MPIDRQGSAGAGGSVPPPGSLPSPTARSCGRLERTLAAEGFVSKRTCAIS